MRLLDGVVALVFIAGPAAAGAEPSAALQAKMTGHFRVAESDDVLQQRLAAAIEHAIEPMNFIARPIARSRLGAVVYYWQEANGFWEHLWAIGEGILWPAFVVYDLLGHLGA